MQTVCQPVKPRCESCDLSGGLCPSANITIKRTRKAAKVTANTSISTDKADPQVKIEIELEEAKYSADLDGDLTPPPPTP